MTYAESLFGRSYESLSDIPTEEFLSLVEVKIEQAITLNGLAKQLKEERPLKVKFGTDPTGPDLHLGHIVPIRLLDLFSRADHHIDLIFGDFTAKVGDPTERQHGRPLLTDEVIAQNMTTFQDQVNRYFDTKRDNVSVHTNSTWLGRMSLSEVFDYLQSINLTEATQRKDFRDRISNGQGVSLAETMYGTLMGIDSVKLNTDVEVGGIDQLLNFQQTRTVQRSHGQNAEDVIMTPIIEGTSGDGRKMSKSYGNYVPVMADQDEIFGKIMSIPDRLIISYFRAFAPVYREDLFGLEEAVNKDPLELKKQLASYITGISVKDYDKGLAARTDFERRFSLRDISIKDARILSPAENLLMFLLQSGDFKSANELRRIAQQGGIKVNGTKITTDDLVNPIEQNTLVMVGKRKIYTLLGEE